MVGAMGGLGVLPSVLPSLSCLSLGPRTGQGEWGDPGTPPCLAVLRYKALSLREGVFASARLCLTSGPCVQGPPKAAAPPACRGGWQPGRVWVSCLPKVWPPLFILSPYLLLRPLALLCLLCMPGVREGGLVSRVGVCREMHELLFWETAPPQGGVRKNCPQFPPRS